MGKISEKKIKIVKELYIAGFSILQIKRKVRLANNSVKKILKNYQLEKEVEEKILLKKKKERKLDEFEKIYYSNTLLQQYNYLDFKKTISCYIIQNNILLHHLTQGKLNIFIKKYNFYNGKIKKNKENK